MAPAQRRLCAALGLLCVCALPGVLSQPGYNPYPDYSCPAGYLPIARFSSQDNPAPVPTVCDEDKCYNEVVGCGPGNVCTQRPAGSVGGFFYQHDCQCNPPYVKGTIVGYKGLGAHTSCYIPGQDPCASNPCQNGGTCVQIRTTLDIPPNNPQDPNGPIIDFACSCPSGFLGKTCLLPAPGGDFPTPVPKSSPPSGPPSGSQGVCGSGAATAFPTRCWFNNDPQGRYVCCDGQGCDGFNSDNLTPHCKNYGYVPPNFGAGGSSTPPSGPPSGGSQGVCGTGGAANYPVRCWYNNDPQGRYVCCDSAGCDGFNPPDYFFPHCKNNGYVPPNL